jgi:hypothetical protein
MKKMFMVIALTAITLTVIPQIQAQTRQQQQELEQIARRSMNGLSPQDRQRVVQIMTDMFVTQGIPRQQAAVLAEENAGTLFLTDIVEATPKQQRQLQEQQRALDASGQRQEQPQQPNNAWPPAQAFTR